ncbi:MAG: host attachment family protein [Hyphomonas sp.]|jgi:protein required for attachment to host cells|nr:host attachment family protein [Hyphomonas sp.]
MKLKTGAWVVVADGGHGIVFENIGTPVSPELKARRVYDQDNPRTHEQGRDRPPRTFSSVGDRRATYESSDIHQVNEDRFIDQIVKDLEADAASGAFKEVAVFAPPLALGRIRKTASGDLARCVIAWIDKDLTKHPVPEITEAVTRALEG